MISNVLCDLTSYHICLSPGSHDFRRAVRAIALFFFLLAYRHYPHVIVFMDFFVYVILVLAAGSRHLARRIACVPSKGSPSSNVQSSALLFGGALGFAAFLSASEYGSVFV